MQNRIQKLHDVISQPLDRRVVESLSKGGRSFDYISGPGMYVLLYQAFGPLCSIEYGEPRRVQYKPGRAGDPDPQEVVEVKCTITVPFRDPDTGESVMVKREGFGTATMKKSFEEMVLKTAATDAMKKAAYSLCLALELSASKTEGEKEWYSENIFGTWTQNACKLHAKEIGSLKTLGFKNLDSAAIYAYKDPAAKATPTNIREIVALCKQRRDQEKKEEAA